MARRRDTSEEEEDPPRRRSRRRAAVSVTEEEGEETEDSPPFYGKRRIRFISSRLRRRRRREEEEDERMEFERRYSKDLRSRQRRRSYIDTRGASLRSSDRKRRLEVDEEDEEEEEGGENRENTRPFLRRSSRPKKGNQRYEISDLSEVENALTLSPVRKKDPEIQAKNNPKKKKADSGGENAKDETTLEEEEEEEDDEEEETENDEDTERNGVGAPIAPDVNKSPSRRPQRSRLPVDRLNYSAPTTNNAVSRRMNGGGIRNLDQYSSDDEFKGVATTNTRRRCRKYNMRENRRATNRYALEPRQSNVVTRGNSGGSRKPASSTTRISRKKKISHGLSDDDDESDSSSSSNVSGDENRFEKRKAKRMNIEKAKMMPLNMNKRDVEMSLYKDRQKVGSSLADVSPMELDMNVSFESVRGINEHINSLKEMVIFPLIYPELFSKFEMNPPRGVLFYGPPGTGKTLVARALACETSKEGKKVAFFMRKGADCLSKWIGESERQLRLLFDQAYLMRPSIIFFDEIDGLAPIRSSRQDQIHSSIVSTLLALMDGLDNRGEIIVIGATNRINSIDPALRRPGRFDRELRFSLPTRDARREILDLHVKKWQPPMDEELINLLATKTIGYCGADLKGLCGEAALNALRRRYPQVYKTTEKLALNVNNISVAQEDFEKAMKNMVPSAHRVSDQFQSPLPAHIKPLLNATYTRICQDIDRIFPVEDAFRPRVLICADGTGHGQTTYLGPAILHHLEKLPAQNLDIPALFSNSARSPEEALAQTIREARRCLPGILYIPHISKLWNTINDTVQKTFLSMISDIQPTAQLFILAISDVSYQDLPQELTELFHNVHKEVFSLDVPGDQERKEFFQPLFAGALAPVAVTKPLEEEDNEELIPVVKTAKHRRLTEKEEKKLRRKEEHRLRELRIFLRDIHLKIYRQQKFFMFRSPVNLEEVYDYLETIQNPMDFDAMLVKLDEGKYECAKDFLDDIDLISENALAYNSDMNYETNKIICHRAAALRDYTYALVKQEMDTDFEEECKEITERRRKLEVELKEMIEKEEEDKKNKTNHENEVNQNASSKSCGHRSRTSRWSKGLSRAKKKKKLSTSTDNEDFNSTESPTASTSQINAEVSEDVSMNPSASNDLITTGIRIDTQKLQERKLELVKVTKGFSVEKLERIFSKCMNIIKAYEFEANRTQLPTDLQVQIDSVKTLQRHQR